MTTFLNQSPGSSSISCPTPEDYCTPWAGLPPTVLPLMLRLPGGRDRLWGLGFLKSEWSV